MSSPRAVRSSLDIPDIAYSSILSFARVDCASFCALALRDEETGLPIKLQPFQLEWLHVVERHRNVVIWAFPEAGKTQLLAIGRILWLLGRDQRKRYAILSSTQGQAVKIIRTIQAHILENPVVRDVFQGKLKKGDLWTDNAFTVERPFGIRDPSLQAYSPEGGSIQGARLDGLHLDDVLTENNTLTKYQRDKVERWIRASAFSRLSHDAWVAVNTNAWHPGDFAHKFAEMGWWHKRYPVIGPDGESAWPERWPLERIERERAERFGPLEFSRQMMCEARDEESSRFKREWIDKCLEKGRGYPTFGSLECIVEDDPELAEEIGIYEAAVRLGGSLDDVPDGPAKDVVERRLFGLPDGFFTVTGVDLAVSRKASADLSALFTILLWPDGTRQVLEIQAGKWSGPEIVSRIVSAHERFQSIVVVESNSAQAFIVQWSKEKAPGMPIRSFVTGRNKLSLEYGIESLGAELEAGMWLIPCRMEDKRVGSEIGEWISEMLDYDPKKHTGDRLMACICPGHRVTTLRGKVPIEDVVEGDLVLTHKGNWRPVLATSCRAYAGTVVSIKASGMPTVTMTVDHPVLRALPRRDTKRNNYRLLPDQDSWAFVPAGSVRSGCELEGDYICSPGLASESLFSPVVSSERSSYIGDVYNLSVEGDESYVVEDMAVHNCWIAREYARGIMASRDRGRSGVSILG